MRPYWYPDVAFPPEDATDSVTATTLLARSGTEKKDNGAIAAGQATMGEERARAMIPTRQGDR